MATDERGSSKKTMEQMWVEFGRWLRAEDVKGSREGGAQAKARASRKSALMGKYGGGEGPKTGPKSGSSKTTRPGRLAPEGGIKKVKSPVGQKPSVKVGKQKPPSISGEGRRYAPRKTNDAVQNSMKRKTK
jgi:hypothetical protein